MTAFEYKMLTMPRDRKFPGVRVLSTIKSKMEKTKHPMDVVIVGGSIAGLMVGIMFLRLGQNVTILERSSQLTVQDQGAGIGVTTISTSDAAFCFSF